MDTRTKIGILLIVYTLRLVLSAPPAPSSSTHSSADSVLRLRRVRSVEDKETGRIFWSAVGDILETLPFLPFTVNVPDVVSGVWNFFTGFFPGGNKRPKRNSTEVVTDIPITRQDFIDYFLYDE